MLNLAERRVLRDGLYLEMTSKAFDILKLLIERRGVIVTKDEILGEVWNGSFVEEGNLAVHVSKLRRTLDETKANQFIETIQGSGYRFIAPVFEGTNEDWQATVESIAKADVEETTNDWAFDSIAVLPLENVTRDEEIDYLADGLTESFINSLSRFPNLRVIARNTVFRYRDKKFDAKQVGETLGVACVMTGRIRVLKDRLSISMELIKTSDGTQLWGATIRRPFTDIFDIQESILTEILDSLIVEINRVQSELNNDAHKSEHSESFRLYLKGKYLRERWTEDQLLRAIECFNESVVLDPTNVHSYVEIVESNLSLYFSDHISFSTLAVRIEPYLRILADLNDKVDVVHSLYGGKKILLDWKIDEGIEHLRYAISLNPNCLIARYRYSDALVLLGRFSDALRELHQIKIIDPLSFPTYKGLGRLFYKMGQFDSAISYLNEALEIQPNDYVCLAILGSTLTELGRYEEALQAFDSSLASYPNIEIVSMIGYVHALLGEREKALKIVEEIESQPSEIAQPGIKVARIYRALGDIELAYENLERAFRERNVDFVSLNSDPRWRLMRSEARFKQLLMRAGIPTDN